MKHRTCYRVTDLAFPIELIQTGLDQFTVKYGEQYNERLPYARAAARLGEAIMHALACDGKLDNRERGEK